MLLRTKDTLFSRSPCGITNNINFSLNSRIFDPTNTKPLLDPNTNYASQFKNCGVKDASQLNTSTSMGFPFFH